MELMSRICLIARDQQTYTTSSRKEAKAKLSSLEDLQECIMVRDVSGNGGHTLHGAALVM